jgi:tetratricopeptide (TPR) repeat protein
VALRFQLRVTESLAAFDLALEMAARIAIASEASALKGEALLCRVAVHALRGDGDAAQRDLEGAARLLRRDRLPQLWYQEAALLAFLGRDREALPAVTRAIAHFRRVDDPMQLARSLQTRAVRQHVLGNLRQSAADTRDAIAEYERAGDRAGAAMCRYNLASTTALMGDLPTALPMFDAAEAELREVGVDLALGVDARIEALMRARLFEEAIEAASAARARHLEAGSLPSASQALVLIARAQLRGGLLDQAAASAERSLLELGRAEPTPWTDLAELVSIHALPGAVELRDRAARLADRLHERGWRTYGVEASMAAARAAEAEGDVSGAMDLLAAVAAARSDPMIEVRIIGWTAETRRRSLDPSSSGGEALAAARAGLKELRSHRRVLAASDLRLTAAGHGDELIEIGTRIAVRSGRGEEIVGWLRDVASSIAVDSQRRDQDGAAADELRSISSRAEQLILSGQPVPPGLRDRRVALERRLRDLDRSTVALPKVRSAQPARPRHRSGQRIVQFVEVDGHLHAVTSGPNVSTASIGGVADISAELRRLRTLLGAVARGRAGSHLAELHRVAAAVTERFREVIPGPDVVVVPSPSLLGVPWMLVGSGSATVAPTRLHAERRRATRGPRSGVVAVAGPGLRSAAAEVRRIATIWDRFGAPSCAITGKEATARAIVSALTDAAVVHLATHGRLRRDNPSFSSFLAADGPLLLRDIAGVSATPDVVVLASCETGLDLAMPGRELLSVASAFLDRGTRGVIAPTMVIDDRESAAVMSALHEALASGLPGPAALRAVTVEIAWDRRPRRAALAHSLIHIGCGGPTSRISGSSARS